MVPDEAPKGSAEQSNSPVRGPRRSRRGGRRHSRPRAPRPPQSSAPAVAGKTATDAPESADELREESMAAPEAAPVEEPGSFREPEPEPVGSAVSQAIEQVTRTIDDLKRVLEQMEETLETLELAERQKIDDERELEALQRAMRQFRGRSGGEGRERH
jgi:hypothetical protein